MSASTTLPGQGPKRGSNSPPTAPIVVSASAEPTGNTANATPTTSNRRRTHAKTRTGLITSSSRFSRVAASPSRKPHRTPQTKPLGTRRATLISRGGPLPPSTSVSVQPRFGSRTREPSGQKAHKPPQPRRRGDDLSEYGVL